MALNCAELTVATPTTIAVPARKMVPSESAMIPRYLPGVSIDEYYRHLTYHHPRLMNMLDLPRLQGTDVIARISAMSSEFEDNGGGGRGESYRTAQQLAGVRGTGIRTLVELAVGHRPGADLPVVLDVLGGDGTIARAVREMAGMPNCFVLTSDIAGGMVKQALAYGLPAIRQPAQELLLRDATVDAVLISYGTHHIPAELRHRVVTEAVRVVRAGGRVVLHDFEPDSSMARFFETVVHRNTAAGHPYPHVGAQTMEGLLEAAGCTDIRVEYIADPFTLTAATPVAAERALLEHLRNMYGLLQIGADQQRQPMDLEMLRHHLNECFPEGPGVTVIPDPSAGYLARLPRTAASAWARKPE